MPLSALRKILLAATAALAISACSGEADGPYEAIFDQQRTMLDLIEQHGETPAEAARQVQTWWQNNERALRALKTRLDALPKDDPEAFAKLTTAHREDIKSINERLRKLRSRYPDVFADPGVSSVITALEQL